MKLKSHADIEVKEAIVFFFYFYNVILLNYQQAITVSRNPRDIIYEEVCKVVERHQDYNTTYIDAIMLACSRKEEIKHYLGDKDST
jgi:hypothetical protein